MANTTGPFCLKNISCLRLGQFKYLGAPHDRATLLAAHAMKVVQTAAELLQPGEVALVVNDSHSFVVHTENTGETADWGVGARARSVDWIIVYHRRADGVSVWIGRLVDQVGGRKKRLRVNELRQAGITESKFFAFVGGPGSRGFRYVSSTV